MASNTAALLGIREELTCPLCLSVFTDPKVLPCQHSFCTSCINDHIATTRKRGMIECPICKKDTIVPADGVSGLKDNFPFKSMVTFLPSEDSSLMCPIHTKQEITMFCDQCEIPLCVYCKDSHPEHEMVDFHVADEQNNKKVGGLLESIKPKCEFTANCIEILNKQLNLCNEEEQRISLVISGHFEKVREMLKKMEEDLLEDLKAKMHVLRDQMTANITSMEGKQETMSKTVQYVQSTRESATVVERLCKRRYFQNRLTAVNLPMLVCSTIEPAFDVQTEDVSVGLKLTTAHKPLDLKYPEDSASQSGNTGSRSGDETFADLPQDFQFSEKKRSQLDTVDIEHQHLDPQHQNDVNEAPMGSPIPGIHEMAPYYGPVLPRRERKPLPIVNPKTGKALDDATSSSGITRATVRSADSALEFHHTPLATSRYQKCHHAENPWRIRSAMMNVQEDPEVIKTEDLYRKVRSILNKLTPMKFPSLVTQLLDQTIDTEERLLGTVDLVFEKAIKEPLYSVAYANLCRYLMQVKVPSKDEPNETIGFRKLLLSRCQREFEKDVDEMEPKEVATESLEAAWEEKMYTIKRRSLAYFRFIGELFKLKMLTETIMHGCLLKLLNSMDENSLECLCRLLMTIGKDIDHEKAKPRVEQYFQQMEKIVTQRKTGVRIRFLLQDIIELRQNNWVPRRADNNPKTIAQIHQEAAKEAQEKFILALQSLERAKKEKVMFTA